jgi:hypothetical protein
MPAFTSAVGTFRTCRDVRRGSGMRTRADMRLNSSGPGGRSGKSPTHHIPARRRSEYTETG